MKLCENHWEELRQAIKSRGLFDFVAGTAKEAISQAVGELEGEKQTTENFDPLMAANMNIWSAGIQCGGLRMMGVDENGNEYCPVCECVKHTGSCDWIEKSADGVAEHLRSLPEPS